MIRCLSLERKAHEHGGYDGTNMCSFFRHWNYCSLVDILWKTEVIGKLYYVRSADENVGGSVVDIFWKNGRNWQAVLRAVSQRNEGGTVGVFCLFEGFNIFLLWVMQAGRPSWIDLINACL